MQTYIVAKVKNYDDTTGVGSYLYKGKSRTFYSDEHRTFMECPYGPMFSGCTVLEKVPAVDDELVVHVLDEEVVQMFELDTRKGKTRKGEKPEQIIFWGFLSSMDSMLKEINQKRLAVEQMRQQQELARQEAKARAMAAEENLCANSSNLNYVQVVVNKQEPRHFDAHQLFSALAYFTIQQKPEKLMITTVNGPQGTTSVTIELAKLNDKQVWATKSLTPDGLAYKLTDVQYWLPTGETVTRHHALDLIKVMSEVVKSRATRIVFGFRGPKGQVVATVRNAGSDEQPNWMLYVAFYERIGNAQLKPEVNQPQAEAAVAA